MEVLLGNQEALQKCLSLTVIFIAFLLAAACSPSGNKFQISDIQNPSGSTPDKTTDPTPYEVHPLSWETSSKPERRDWTTYLHDRILNTWSTLLPGSNDMHKFCPRYSSLDNNQRANVWAALLSAMSKFESSYNPLNRFHEDTMGTDSVTKRPVYSEGLLQLSYQDIRGYPFCEFDWEADKKLSDSDPRKTIFDPYKNLDCGAGIMARQIARKGLIAVSSGPYWSVIKEGGRYSQIPKIITMVKELPFCN